MEKVWIVEADYFNGEGSSRRFAGAFSTKELAEKFCNEENDKATSSYSDKYEVLGWTEIDGNGDVNWN
jgi:hypothetical protein